MPLLRRYRFVILRRVSQISIIALFAGGSLFGWHILRGNLSSSKILDRLTLVDPFAVLQIMAAGRIVSSEALVGALIVLFFFGLIAGRAFCSWICPLNMVTDLANWLRKKTGLDSAGKGIGISRKTRYWVMAISLAVSSAAGIAAFEWVSPVSMLHRGVIFGMGLGWTMVLAVFFLDLFAVGHGFCGHICPLGGFYSVMTRFSVVRVRHDSERCTRCGKCREICPEEQVLFMVGGTSGAVTSGECTNCGRCVEVCEDSAMKFGFRFPADARKTSIA